jgi:light-regulated signal transduction histidine kinase (bacteriophytochrome)
VKSKNSQLLTENELAALNILADIGELTTPVSHEFNNFLNTVLLHIAVLEPKLSQDLQPDLAEIRKQARNVSAIIKELQQFGRQRPLPRGPVDLNDVVRATLAGIRREHPASGNRRHEHVVPPISESSDDQRDGEPISLEVHLDATAAPVLALKGDLLRLCTFLLRGAMRGPSASNGPIVVRTKCSDDKVGLSVEYSGLPASPESLAVFFDLSNPDPDRTHRLELAACKTLVKRLQGRISAERRADDRIAVRVELPRHGAGAS